LTPQEPQTPLLKEIQRVLSQSLSQLPMTTQLQRHSLTVQLVKEEVLAPFQSLWMDTKAIQSLQTNP
jgi:hypothetical protein